MRAAIAGAAFAALTFASVASASPRIATVDFDRASRETEEGLRLAAAVRKARARLAVRCDHELEAAACSELWSTSERESVELALGGVRRTLARTLSALAAKQNFDLVVDRKSVALSAAADLTEQLVEAYNRAPRGGPGTAVVDTERCVRESEAGLRESARARKLWAAHRAECAADAASTSCRIVASFADEADFVRDALFPLRMRVTRILDALADERGLELVVEARDVVVAGAPDLTDAVIDALNAGR